MSHYFDDILHRHVGGAQTPKSPVMSPNMPRLRRSSTTRSIAARSDFDTNDLNGYDEEADGDFPTRRGSMAPAGMMMGDPERLRERQEADSHLHTYITQKLEKVRLEQAADDDEEEFEAHASD